MSTLADLERHLNEIMANMGKTPGTKLEDFVGMGGKLDGHVWVTHEDGTIYDPWFDEYNTIVSTHNCHPERFYKATKGKLKKDLWEFAMKVAKTGEVWNKKVKPGLDSGIPLLEILKDIKENPTVNNCTWNAYAYHKVHPEKTKICIGSMGWKKKATGDVYWEFG